MAIGLNRDAVNNSQQTSSEQNEEEVSEFSEEPRTKKSSVLKNTKAIAVIAAVAVCAVLLVAFSGVLQPKDEIIDETSSSQSTEISNNTETTVENVGSGNTVYQTDGTTIDPDGINPGIPNYQYSDKNVTTPYVYNSSDFIKDLNGLDISAVYNVESREYIEDYVTYETRRAIVDDGMELYWLEAAYNGKKYRIQTPFYYFKDLGESGICKVELEVLTLVGGGKVISYMQVIQDGD